MDRNSLFYRQAALLRPAGLLQRKVPGCEVIPVPMKNTGTVCRIRIRQAGVEVKAEVTPVLRGAVYPPEFREVQPAVEDEFGHAEMQLVSWADFRARHHHAANFELIKRFRLTPCSAACKASSL